MSRRAETIAPLWFENLYAADGDPWRFVSSPYELGKYAHTIATLPEARYHNALEIGCSIGVLTFELAQRCDRLLAVDAAETPLVEARRRCKQLACVQFERMFVPAEWPAGLFDLIVLSEVVYYLDARDVALLADRCASALTSGGTIILVHWTGKTDYPLSGDEAAELFIAGLKDRVESAGGDRRPEYRLDVLRRR